jgi:hypothetical protein
MMTPRWVIITGRVRRQCVGESGRTKSPAGECGITLEELSTDGVAGAWLALGITGLPGAPIVRMAGKRNAGLYLDSTLCARQRGSDSHRYRLPSEHTPMFFGRRSPTNPRVNSKAQALLLRNAPIVRGEERELSAPHPPLCQPALLARLTARRLTDMVCL